MRLTRQEWLKQLIGVFDQAEDLESLEDIHAVSSIVHLLCESRTSPHYANTADPPTVTLNDNTILEYMLQDEVFLGILGVLECESASSGLARMKVD